MKKLLFLILLLPSVNLLAQLEIESLTTPSLSSSSKSSANRIKTSKLSKDSNAAVYLIATGGTAVTASNVSAAGGAGFLFQKERWSGILSANWGGTVSKRQNADSIPLSSLVFPDIQNTSGLLKLAYCLNSNKYFKSDSLLNNTIRISIIADFAYQLINTTKDSTDNNASIIKNYSFNVINGGVGFNFRVPLNTGTSNKLAFSATVEYCGTWVSPNTNESFGQYYYNETTKNSLPKKIGGIYANISFHLNESQIYLRCYYTPSNNIVNSVADRAIFSVGINTYIKTLL